MSKDKITAKIKGATWDPHSNTINGRIYDDVRDRWPDGTSIYTSYVKTEEHGDGIYETLNSVYDVEFLK